MGQLGAALANISAAKTGMQSAVGLQGHASPSDPGIVQAPAPELPAGNAPDFGMSGLQQADPGAGAQPVANPAQTSGGITLQDLLPQNTSDMLQPPPQQASGPNPITGANPYTPYDDPNVTNPVAAGDGGNGDAPITIAAMHPDSWHPSHHEGWLGKALDTLIMLRSGRTPFKDRKDQENMDDAMQGWQANPDRAISRATQVGANQGLAAAQHIGQYQQMQSAIKENQAQTDSAAAMAQDRQIASRDKAVSSLGGLMTAVSKAKDPEAMYQNVMPLMQDIAKAGGLPDDYIKPKYDPDWAKGLAATNTPSATQEELSLRQAAQDSENAYRKFDENMAQQRLVIDKTNSMTEQFNANTSRMNATTEQERTALMGNKSAGVVNIFHRGPDGKPDQFAGTMTKDGQQAALYNPGDGKWYAYRLRKKGDINSRVPDPASQPMLDASLSKASGGTYTGVTPQ